MSTTPTLALNKGQEFVLTTPDNTCIFVRDWCASAPTAPGIVLMHGLGEHSGRYLHLAQFFQELGFRVRSFDQRGHGQSSGDRGDVPNSGTILRDTQFVVRDFGEQLSSPPLVFAHSMGGLFASHFALANLQPIAGLILSSPALSVKLSYFQKILFKLSKILIPHLGVTHGTNGRYLSHDLEVVRAYQNDPLVHTRISASLFQSMLTSMAYVQANATHLKVPLLLLVADADLVVDPEGSKAFAAQLQTPASRYDVTSIHYPGFYHEIFNELEAKRAFEDVKIWLENKNFMPATLKPLQSL